MNRSRACEPKDHNFIPAIINEKSTDQTVYYLTEEIQIYLWVLGGLWISYGDVDRNGK